jgi:hypothetical protein
MSDKIHIWLSEKDIEEAELERMMQNQNNLSSMTDEELLAAILEKLVVRELMADSIL